MTNANRHKIGVSCGNKPVSFESFGTRTVYDKTHGFSMIAKCKTRKKTCFNEPLAAS